MSLSITIRDGTGYLFSEDVNLIQEIVKATSFELKGAEYRPGIYDKTTKLVRNNKFPVGLLDRICRVATFNGVKPEISYANTPSSFKPDIYTKLDGIQLRDYQQEAELAAVLGDNGIFRAPTGSGKSAIAAAIVVAKHKHALIVVPTIDLLHQFRNMLSECLVPVPNSEESRTAQTPDEAERGRRGAGERLRDPIPSGGDQWRIGQLGDGVVDPQPITVATVRTISKVLNIAYESYSYAELDDSDDTKINAKELQDWIESLGTVIFDECHLVAARLAFNVVTKIPALYKYGMSASPWRDDGADLMIEAAVGPPLFYVSAERLVKDGYLLAPTVKVIDTESWWVSSAWGTTCANCKRQWLKWTQECECGCRTFRSQFNDAYKEEIVENPLRNQRIAQIAIDCYRPGWPVLVLIKQIKHGKLLSDLIPGSIFLSGKDKGAERKQVFDLLREDKLKIIICTTIADQGLDIPNLGALVLGSAGKASTRHLQRLGRIVRPVNGKPRPLVVDFNDRHVHGWFLRHEKIRRKVEAAEWGSLIEYVYE